MKNLTLYLLILTLAGCRIPITVSVDYTSPDVPGLHVAAQTHLNPPPRKHQ